MNGSLNIVDDHNPADKLNNCLMLYQVLTKLNINLH